jgi:hypothetical protein
MPDFVKKNYFCQKVMTVNKYILFKITGLFIFASALFSSCSFLDTTPVKIPSYISVPKIGFSTSNYGSIVQGDSSSKFVDVWIYDNGSLLGNIGLPAIIPDQKTGLTEIEFDAGIMKSGQDEDRIPYPFISRITYPNTRLSPNVIDTFYPEFKYLPSTKFSINEGFEILGSSLAFTYDTLNNSSGGKIIKVKDSTNLTPSIILGKYSGEIILQPNAQFRMLSSEFLKEILMPTLGSPIYLELDYKSDLQIAIEMWSFDQNGNLNRIPELVTNPTTNWNKVYVCLDQDIVSTNPGTLFQVTISVYNNTAVPQNTFLDNIKLVHF